jgi:hypothetical protein
VIGAFLAYVEGCGEWKCGRWITQCPMVSAWHCRRLNWEQSGDERAILLEIVHLAREDDKWACDGRFEVYRAEPRVTQQECVMLIDKTGLQVLKNELRANSSSSGSLDVL